MLSQGVRDARWVAEENFHLTLRFIGEVDNGTAADISAALWRVRGAPITLGLAGSGHFESRRRVRALWVGVDAPSPIDALRRRIDNVLERAGIAPEGRRFTPHVTIARLRNAPPAAVAGWLEGNALFRAAPVTIDHFVLYESFLTGEGSIYTPIEEYPLGLPAIAAE